MTDKFVQVGEIMMPAALAEEMNIMDPIFEAARNAGVMLECGCCPIAGERCPECDEGEEDEEE